MISRPERELVPALGGMTVIRFSASMTNMNTNDIKHLAHLSRLHLEEGEVETYTKQFDEIVAYVDKIKEVSNKEIPEQVRDDNESLQDNAPVNVFREDIVEVYQNPEIIIDEAPSHQDNFVKVKKILNQ